MCSRWGRPVRALEVRGKVDVTGLFVRRARTWWCVVLFLGIGVVVCCRSLFSLVCACGSLSSSLTRLVYGVSCQSRTHVSGAITLLCSCTHLQFDECWDGHERAGWNTGLAVRKCRLRLVAWLFLECVRWLQCCVVDLCVAGWCLCDCVRAGEGQFVHWR